MPETVSPRPRPPSRPPAPHASTLPPPRFRAPVHLDNMWTRGDFQSRPRGNRLLHTWTNFHLLSKSQPKARRLLDLFAERRIKMHDPQTNVWKGAAAGLAAGLAASWAMTQFLHLYGKLSEIHEEKEEPQHSVNRGKQESAQQKEQGDDATVKAADKLSRGLFHHALSQEEKKVAGPAVHYGFGALTGVAYGAL